MDVHVIARNTGLLGKIVSEDGVTGIPVQMERDPSLFADLRSLVRIFSKLVTIRPPLVVYGTPKASLLGAIAAFVLRTPRRVYFLYGLRAETMSGFGRYVMLASEKLIVWLSTDVLVVGQGLKEKAGEIGIDARRMRVLGRGSANGIDFEKYSRAGRDQVRRRDLRTALSVPSTAQVVGFVGRVTPDKGVDTLVQAVAAARHEVANVFLMIVGPDEGIHKMAPATRSLMSEPWIRLVGNVPETADYYSAMDVLCLPSLREGLPTVLLEAGAAGVPIVATNATGTSDLVENMVSGLVVPIDDVFSLTAALVRVLSDNVFGRGLAETAQARVKSDFDQARVWQNLYNFYSGAASVR
jgi:glycosyltransferase involved in cell wall biosynthesis